MPPEVDQFMCSWYFHRVKFTLFRFWKDKTYVFMRKSEYIIADSYGAILGLQYECKIAKSKIILKIVFLKGAPVLNWKWAKCPSTQNFLFWWAWRAKCAWLGNFSFSKN